MSSVPPIIAVFMFWLGESGWVQTAGKCGCGCGCVGMWGEGGRGKGEVGWFSGKEGAVDETFTCKESGC